MDVGVGVGVTVRVLVGVGVAVHVGVFVGVGVGVGVIDLVGVLVGVGVFVADEAYVQDVTRQGVKSIPSVTWSPVPPGLDGCLGPVCVPHH